MKRHHYIGVAVAMLASLVIQRSGHALTAVEICNLAKKNDTLINSTIDLPKYVSNPLASLDVGVDVSTIIDSSGRYVLCWDSSKPITSPLVLEGTAQFPVTVYGLSVKPTDNISDPNSKTGVNLLTVTGPNFLFQNLSATNLRGPIVMNGSASMKDSVLSCDTTVGNIYANAILELKGSNEVITNVSITNCRFGMGVMGERNIITDVKITYDKTQAASADDGLMGVSLGASNILKASSLGKTVISGYTTAIEMKSAVSEISRSRSINVLSNGAVKMNDFAELSGSSITGTIHVNGNNVLISKNTLAADPAVLIAKGIGVKVTQNKYPFKTNTTVTYADPIDIKDHTLFDQAWVSAELSDVDPTNYAKRLVGKLMDQNSTATDLEFYLYDAASGGEIFEYFLSCPIGTTSNEICFSDKSDANEVCIHKGEKVFDCSKESLGKDFQVPLDSFVRLLTNTPTASVMSEKIAIKPKITIVAIAESTVTNGGENSPEAPSNPTGDDDPKIPDPTDTGDNANGSAQGNGATSDGFALAGETPSGYTAGASPLGSCTLSTVGADQGQTASALVWLLALLPLPLMIPFRNSKKDDE